MRRYAGTRLTDQVGSIDWVEVIAGKIIDATRNHSEAGLTEERAFEVALSESTAGPLSKQRARELFVQLREV